LKIWTPLSGHQWYQINGYYNSWDCGSIPWEDMYEVEPRDKTITVYERV
jgi:hypothetical protein